MTASCPNDGATLRVMPSGVLQCPLCPFNVAGNQKVLEELYAFVSVDPAGREGFIAVNVGGVMMSMTNSVRETLEKFRPDAERAMATIPGYKLRMIRFSKREVIE